MMKIPFPFIKQSIGCHQKVSLILASLSSNPHERGIPMVGNTNEALSHLRTAGEEELFRGNLPAFSDADPMQWIYSHIHRVIKIQEIQN